MNRRTRPLPHGQRGLSLIELLVAMTLGLLVTLVAIGLVLAASQGLRSVDAGSDARDKERLAFDQLSNIVLQAGYEDWGNPLAPLQSVARMLGSTIDAEPDLFGWNNAIYNPPPTDALSTTTDITNGNRPARCGSNTSSACRNGSDILAVRFQGSSLANNGTGADGSMLDCNGDDGAGMTSSAFNLRMLSVFHVAISNGSTEPSLQCAVFKPATQTWSASRPLLEGVESFQVLYGTDGVRPGEVPLPATNDGVADRWLRADELTVAGDLVGTRANWRRVRAVRIGLVVRGPAGSAVSREVQVLHPLGDSMGASSDTGSIFSAPADGRLRTVRTITLHLRNDLAMP